MERIGGRERRPALFLDACCAINLLASGAAKEILEALPFEFWVTPDVLEKEVLYVLEDDEGRPGEEDDRAGDDATAAAVGGDVRRVTLEPLVGSGLIRKAAPLSGDELETLVSLAFELDDGEAETAAAAIHRGGGLATDDRKAIRVIGGRAGEVLIYRTAALVRAWAEASEASEARVREVVVLIERQASFVPPRDDPEREWWFRVGGGDLRVP